MNEDTKNTELGKNHDFDNKQLKLDWFYKGLAIGCVVTLLTTLLVITIVDNRGFLKRKDVNQINAYVKLLKENYYEDISDEQLKENILHGLFNLDKYTTYYTVDEKTKLDDKNSDYVGVGIRTTTRTYDNRCVIYEVIKDSPAEKAGLQKGDVIIEVDGVSIKETTPDEISNMIRGEKDTEVTLTVVRENDILKYTVTRQPIENTIVFRKSLTEKTDLIELVHFDADADKQFNKAIDESTAENIIIDLRNNGGGHVDVMMEILNHITPSGNLVFYTLDKKGNKKEYITEGTDKASDHNYIVLINNSSASCSEIFSSYMRDYGYAKLVGMTTYGKGVVQDLVTFDDNSAIKVTSGYYYTSKDVNFDGIGVNPDYYEYNDDRQIEVALEMFGDTKVNTTDDTVSVRDIKLPGLGEKYADIEIPSLGISSEIVRGSTQEIVDTNDIVISGKAGFCGGGTPIVICGHRTGSLKELKNIKANAEINITTNYGTYKYRVVSLRIGTVNAEGNNIETNDGEQLLRFNGGVEDLYIYTCYDGDTTSNKRYVVKAEYVKGTKITD